MCKLGWRRYIRRPGGEYSFRALEKDLRDAVSDVEMIPKEGLVGDHVANGESENAVKEVNRQFRVLKSSLEEKLQPHVVARTRCALSDEISHQRQRQDGGPEEDRKAMVEPRA